MGRKKSGIVRIRLNTPTIQGYSLEPAPVNFFYGKNGVGKTSIGRALADPNAEITWKDGKPLQVFLFNEDYTEQVIQSVSGLPGVYALSGKNADIQRQIEEKTARKEQIDVSVAEMKRELTERRKNAAETDAERIRGIWKVTAEIRRKYPEAAGADDPEAFALRLSTYKANAYSQDGMAAAYEMAYGPKVDAEPYLHLYVTSFPACPLLAVPVFRHSETEAGLSRDAGCLDWAISGHDRYLRDDRCPFCGQKLPDDFEARFRESLEPKGQADMEKLKAFSEEYAEAAQKARETVLKNLGNPVGSNSYRLKGTQLLSRLENNRILIQRKMDNPRLEIHLEDTEQLIRELNEIEEEVNKKISRMIRMARDVPQARKRCEKVIWESMAWSCQDLLRVLTAGREENEAELSSLELKVRTEEGRARLLDREIRELRGAMTDISGTMEKINRSLNDNDFTGFRFAKRDDNTYEIVRENGPATGLSEGERKFVAFLYFYHTVLGSRRADAAPEEKVLVIDDPATSTDSEVMSIFAVMISGYYFVAKSREGGFLAPDQYETVMVIEEANKVLIGNDTAGSSSKCGGSPSLAGESIFEEILDQAAGYGLFVIAITQKISQMPSSVIANCGLLFVGRLTQPEDVNLAVRMIGREERREDVDVVKFIPKMPVGWMIVKSSRVKSFVDAEPVLIKVKMLNKSKVSNTLLDEFLEKGRYLKMQREFQQEIENGGKRAAG